MTSPQIPQVDKTVAACLTASGRAAVATVGLAGTAIDCIAAQVLFARNGKPVVLLQEGELRTCFFRWKDQPPEQVVVARVAPHILHIHCHGGPAAVERIVRALREHGAQIVDWSTWLVHTCSTFWEAQCWDALARAPTLRVAKVLLEQVESGLPRELEAIANGLEAGDIDSSRARLQLLRERWQVGRHLLEPWFVLLAGPANAGKSSLFNALVGYQRVIVHDQPGTTRDVIKKTTAVDGWPVVLADSAGFHDAPALLDQVAMERARKALAEADLILWITDLTQPWLGPESLVTPALGGKFEEANRKILFVHNKADLVPICERGIRLRGRPPGLVTSATWGEGLEALLVTIARQLVPKPLPPNAAVPFRPEHKELLDKLDQLVRKGAFEQAIHAMRQFCAFAQNSPEGVMR